MTLEHNPEFMASLSRLHQKNVMVYMTEGVIDQNAKDVMDNERIGEFDVKKAKTQSQELRHILFKNWGQQSKIKESEDYYNQEMNKIKAHYKSKLE